jgi:hypothetical protein
MCGLVCKVLNNIESGGKACRWCLRGGGGGFTAWGGGAQVLVGDKAKLPDQVGVCGEW